MKINDKAIAFFDSGVGGLTVFSKIKDILPNENYIYFGDLKNSPYGEKEEDELIIISKKIFDFFEKKDVKAVVMACNTTSATAYEKLKNDYKFKIYPIIQSCAKEIASYDAKRICILATEATVKTHAYKKYINLNNPDVEVIEQACPSWVKMVEENKIMTSECKNEVQYYLEKILCYNPDKIVLGCTHYPFLTDIMSQFADKDKIINPADIFVKYIKDDLDKNFMLKNTENGQEEFYVSAYPEKFKHASGMFYKLENLPQKIAL